MSPESLLLLAFLILIPLLERLIRGLRAQTSRARAGQVNTPAPERPALPARPSLPRVAADVDDGPTAHTELPRDTAPPTPAPPSPALRHAAPERSMSRDRTRARRQSQRGPAAPVAHSLQPMRRGTALRRIADGDLRRAIVLMTILGPCRALEPGDTHRQW